MTPSKWTPGPPARWIGPLAIVGALLAAGFEAARSLGGLGGPALAALQKDGCGRLCALQHVLMVAGLTVAAASAAMYVYHHTVARRMLHLAFFFILLELFYRFAYGGPISSGLLLSVSETSRRETIELLAGHPILTCGLSLVMFLGISALWLCWRADLIIPRLRLRRGAIFAAGAIGASLTIGILRVGDPAPAEVAAVSDLRATFPFDLAYALGEVAQDSWDTHRQAATRARFAFSNVRLIDASLRNAGTEVYVVVVGETSRRSDWSLFGYPRATTPRLDAIKQDLILFDRVSANATNTILSLPLVLTRSTTETPVIARSQKSVIALLKQAGFATYWISNQERSTATTNPIAQIASDADHVSFASDMRPELRDAGLDSNLIPRLNDALRNVAPGSKTVIFLHMEGSHFGYKDRYPAGFANFADAEPAPRVLPARQLRLLNEYDNSIYFTDHVVRQAIDRLASCRCRSGLIYFSDHGERLFDNGLDDAEFGHGFPTVSRREIDVPVFFWLSASYQAANPGRGKQLAANAHAIGQLHNVFETIVDLAAVEYDGREAALSLFSDRFKSPAQLDVLNMQQDTVFLSAL